MSVDALLSETRRWDSWAEVFALLADPTAGMGKWDYDDVLKTALPRSARPPCGWLGPRDPLISRALRAEELRALEMRVEQRVAKDPSPLALAVRGRVRRVLGAPGAEGDLTAALDADPACLPAKLWLAELLIMPRPGRAGVLLEGAQGSAAVFYRAVLSARQGRWERALTLLEGVRGPAEARMLAGLAKARLRRPGEALVEYDAALKSGLGCAALHWHRAFAQRALRQERAVRGSVAEALKLYSELDPMDLLLGPALKAESARRSPSARTVGLLQRKIGKRAMPAWALAVLADTRRCPQIMQYRLAVEDLRRAAKLEPGTAWIHARLGRALVNTGETEDAKKAMDRAIALEPRCGWLRGWRGELHRRQGRAKAALADLDASVRLAPDYPFAHVWRGKLLRGLGRIAEAGRELELALRLEPRYEWAYAELSQIRREEKKWPEAARLMVDALERDPKFHWKELAELDAAVKEFPDDALIRAWRARALIGEGDLGRAQEDLESAPAGAPFVELVRGELYSAMGDGGRALIHYHRASKLKASSCYAGAMGLHLYQEGDLEGAITALGEAIKRNDTTARYFCTLGAALLEAGRAPAALVSLNRACGVDPTFSEALAHRALANGARGRKTAARRDAEEAERLRPDCPWTAWARLELRLRPEAALEDLKLLLDRGRGMPSRIRARAAERLSVAVRSA